MSDNFCILLAGGKGKRLWPVSRGERPKQFIDFFGTGRTLLQSTYDRFAQLLPEENIIVCTSREFVGLVREQLPGITDDRIIAEPIHRNTAPSVAWANRRIRLRCPEARIIVSPSDQLVLNEESFACCVKRGFDLVGQKDFILTLGVNPTRPEPGYGYIQMGEEKVGEETFKVQSFTEKPDRDFAQLFVGSGEFLWNTGLMLSSVQTMRDTLVTLFPEIPDWLDAIPQVDNLEVEEEFMEEQFPVYPNISMDRGVLERSDNVYVMRCDFGWADIGSWHSAYECLQKQDGSNVVMDSEVMLDDCRNNIIRLPKGRLGVFSGLEGFIVAEEDNVLFICKKEDSSSRVKKFANEVGIRYGEKFI